MLLKFGLLLPTYNHIGSEHLSSAAYGTFAIMIGSSIVLCGVQSSSDSALSPLAFLVSMVIHTLGEGILVATQAYIASVIGKSYLARVIAIAASGGKAIASGYSLRSWLLD
jgi:hypothetical protein